MSGFVCIGAQTQASDMAMRRWPKVGLLLVHCIRRWPNIRPMSHVC